MSIPTDRNPAYGLLWSTIGVGASPVVEVDPIGSLWPPADLWLHGAFLPRQQLVGLKSAAAPMQNWR